MSNVWDEVPTGAASEPSVSTAPTPARSAPRSGSSNRAARHWTHLHHGSEEMVVVLRGTSTLRTPKGERVLAEGDVVVFPRGPEGAKRIRNESETAARVLIVSTNADPDVTEYPDTGKWVTSSAASCGCTAPRTPSSTQGPSSNGATLPPCAATTSRRSAAR